MNKLHISPFFVLTWAFLLVFNSPESVFALFCAAAIHESAHFVAFLVCGARVRKLELNGFGASVHLYENASLSYAAEMVVALAGVVANALCFAVLWLLPPSWLLCDKVWALTCHASLGAVNLLPIIPLDGGRALQAALSLRLDEKRTHNVTKAVGFVLLVPLTAFSVVLLAKSGYNFSLLVISVYLFLCLATKK